MADFSMGDLWGVQKTYPTQYDRGGISVLLINTNKAQQLIEKCNISQQKIDITKVISCNPFLITSVKPHPKRAEFFARYKKENFNKLVRELLGIRPIWLALPYALFRKMLRGAK